MQVIFVIQTYFWMTIEADRMSSPSASTFLEKPSGAQYKRIKTKRKCNLAKYLRLRLCLGDAIRTSRFDFRQNVRELTGHFVQLLVVNAHHRQLV